MGAVTACSFSGSPRWQLRWVSLFTARLALKEAMKPSSSGHVNYHVDVKAARNQIEKELFALSPNVQENESKDDSNFGSFEAFSDKTSPKTPSETSPSNPINYDHVCDYASLHIESIISTACSASTFILGDDLGLTVLQYAGLLFLGDIVTYYMNSIDPDVLDNEEGGQPESILMQFTSQINSSIRPSLALRNAPRYKYYVLSMLSKPLSTLASLTPLWSLFS